VSANQCTEGHVVAPHKWYCNCGQPTTLYLSRATAVATLDPPEEGGGDVAAAPAPAFAAPVALPDPRRRSPLRGVAIGIFVILGLFGALVVGGIALGLLEERNARTTIDAYVAGTGTTPFVANDLGFQATFPKEPSRETEEIDIVGGTVQVTYYKAQLGQHFFGVWVYEMGDGETFDPQAGFEAAAEEVGGTIEATSEVPFAGGTATEGLIEVENGASKMLILQHGRRVYILEATGPDNPPVGYEAFKDSFSLL
jgi:hypothetical protein